MLLFKEEKFSGTLTSSSEGQVFWVKINDGLNLPWIWGMDCIIRFFTKREFSEFFMNVNGGWVSVLR